ncbi:MAG TPA: AAA family ATPase [Synergistaceae bacterium]|nr:AAA family ATPase [Synergistaceae bacterium]
MNFRISDIGQFAEASVAFGDLTLLVGAQGTGKSIFLQLFKLSQDQDFVKNMMNQFGQDWDKRSKPGLMEAYFGEGMSHIWGSQSRILCNDKDAAPSPRMPKKSENPAEAIYYIPAQRVLTMLTGWPQPYRSYTPRDPFVVKNFSERIRLYLEGLKERESLFPVPQKIKEPIRDLLNTSIFHGASLSRSATAGQKEVRLHVDSHANRGISYMAWSTGQREFLPLLLGCYELLSAGRIIKSKEIEWVVLEEPEMGLHPMGIFAVMALALDLLSRGYKVVITTHSSNVLDIVWAMEAIKRQQIDDEGKKIRLISQLLDLPADNSGISTMIGKALGLEFRTHSFYYKDGRVHTKDISSLDPGDEDEIVAGWGGLASYSGRVSDTVAEAVRMSTNA